MELNKNQFCTLSSSASFLSWLKGFSRGLYDGLLTHLKTGKGCGANTQKMLKILGKIMRSEEGPTKLQAFLVKNYPHIIKPKPTVQKIIMKIRYDNISQAINDTTSKITAHKPYRIMEIGTFNGQRAKQMIATARKNGRTNVEYYGFDLFEEMTLPVNKQEFSKAKLPPSIAKVKDYLNNAGARIFLFRGNTKETLPATIPTLPPMDIVFQDGGHSIQTIENDWNWAKQILAPHGIYLFDDYYENRDDVGCKHLISHLLSEPNKEYKVSLLEPIDKVPSSGLKIRIVKLTISR